MKLIYHEHKNATLNFIQFVTSLYPKKEVFGLKRHPIHLICRGPHTHCAVLFPYTMVAMVHWLSRYLKAPRRSTEAVTTNISSY